MRRSASPLATLDLTPPTLAADAKIFVAFSGGLDSSVLLHLLATRLPQRVQAIHVHHGLQASADAWAEHCRAVCAQLNAPYHVQKVKVDATHAAGPEGAARQVRYQAMRQLLAPGDYLATAHHRDDQAETVLLRLLRGTGVQGLAGMRTHSEFAPGWLWRPLLDLPREQLREYAEVHGLKWIDDPHNSDPRYARSWLRAEVLPLLQQHFPQASRSLTRAAQLAAETHVLLDELALQDSANAARGDALSVPALLQLSAPRLHNLLRFWLRGQGYEMPPAHELARIADEVLLAAVDAAPRFAWPACELRRYRDLLYAMAPLREPEREWSATWAGGESRLQLPEDCGWLEADQPPAQALTVRLARAGEVFKPAGSGHTRTLKNLFQEAGVPPWVRSRTPVIESDGAIAAVAGLGGAPGWEQQRQRLTGALRWRHPLRGVASPLAL